MDLVTIASFSLIPEAYLAKNLLDAEGIPAFLNEATASDMLHLTSEIKLQVAADKVEQAQAILESVERHDLDKEAAADAEAHSKDVPADQE